MIKHFTSFRYNLPVLKIVELCGGDTWKCNYCSFRHECREAVVGHTGERHVLLDIQHHNIAGEEDAGNRLFPLWRGVSDKTILSWMSKCVNETNGVKNVGYKGLVLQLQSRNGTVNKLLCSACGFESSICLETQRLHFVESHVRWEDHPFSSVYYYTE